MLDAPPLFGAEKGTDWNAVYSDALDSSLPLSAYRITTIQPSTFEEARKRDEQDFDSWR
jgi:hypothetical protein